MALQRSVPHSLFVICINDLAENIDGIISKLADETKIGGIEDSEGGHLRSRQDLDQLGKETKE